MRWIIIFLTLLVITSPALMTSVKDIGAALIQDVKNSRTVDTVLEEKDKLQNYALDGDTIIVDGKEYDLLQVDSPELGSECAGVMAQRRLNEKLVTSKNNLTLKQDPLFNHSDNLAYPFLDDLNLAVWLVHEGLAVPLYPNNMRGIFAHDLDEALKYAKRNKKGLWGHCRKWNYNPMTGINTGPARYNR